MALTPEEQAELAALEGQYGGEYDPWAVSDSNITSTDTGQNSGIVGDLVTSAQEGFYQTGSDLMGALNLTSAEGWLEDKVKEQQDEYSPEMLAAKAEFGMEDDKTLWNRALFSEIAKQGGQLPMYMIPGGAAAKGINVAAKGLGAIKKARKAVQAANKSGLKNRINRANKALDKAEGRLKVAATAAGYGTVNGLIIGEGTADEVQDYLTNRTPEDWMKDDSFREIYESNISNGVDEDEAWDMAIQDSIDGSRAEAFWKGAGMGAATGSVGGPLLQKAVTGGIKGGVGKSAAAGVLAEAPTEFIEEGGQALLAGDIADEDVNAMDRALMGAALGGIIGGGAGGVGGAISHNILQKNNEEMDAISPNVDDLYTDMSGSMDLRASAMTPITETATTPFERQQQLTEKRDQLGSAQDIMTHEIETTPLQEEMDDALISNAAAARESEKVGTASKASQDAQRKIDKIFEVIADANKTKTFTGGYGVLSQPKGKKGKKKVAPPVSLGGDEGSMFRPAGAGIGESSAQGYGEIGTTTKGTVGTKPEVKEKKVKKVKAAKAEVEEEKVTDVQPEPIKETSVQKEIREGSIRLEEARKRDLGIIGDGLMMQDNVRIKGMGTGQWTIQEQQDDGRVRLTNSKGKAKLVPVEKITPIQEDATENKEGAQLEDKVEVDAFNTAMDKVAESGAVEEVLVEEVKKKVIEEVNLTAEDITDIDVNDDWVWDSTNEIFIRNETGEKGTPPLKVMEKFHKDNATFENEDELISWMADEEGGNSRKYKRIFKDQNTAGAEWAAKQKADRQVRKLQKEEDNGIPVAQDRKDKAFAAQEKAQGVWDKLQAKASKEADTITTEETVARKVDLAVAAPTGVAVEGQEEVKVEETPKVPEAPVDLDEKPMVVPENREEMLKAAQKKLEAKKKQKAEEEKKDKVEKVKAPMYTAATLAEAVALGDVGRDTAFKVASTVGVENNLISQEEADLYVEQDKAGTQEVNTLARKLAGFDKVFGADSLQAEWATENLHKYPDFDAMAEADGFRATVKRLMSEPEPTPVEVEEVVEEGVEPVKTEEQQLEEDLLATRGRGWEYSLLMNDPYFKSQIGKRRKATGHDNLKLIVNVFGRDELAAREASMTKALNEIKIISKMNKVRMDSLQDLPMEERRNIQSSITSLTANLEQFQHFKDKSKPLERKAKKALKDYNNYSAEWADEPAMPSWVDTSASKPMNTAENILNKYKERFDGKLPRNVIVVDDYDALPSDRKKPNLKRASAFYSPATKKVYVLANNVIPGKELNTLFHEKSHQLLQQSPEWNGVLANVKMLLAEGDPQVTAAYKKAVANVPQGRLDLDPTAIDKETVAYILTDAPQSSIAKRIIRAIKKILERLTGYQMTAQDVIDIVVLKTEADLETDTEARVRQYSEKMDTMDNIEVQDVAELEQSVDPEFQTQMMGDVKQSHYKALDDVGKNVSNLGIWAKEKGLGFIPMRPLLEMMDRILPNGTSISGVQDAFGIADAAANSRIETMNAGLNKDMYMFQKDHIADYRKMVRVALMATRNNKDAEGTPVWNQLSKIGKEMYVRLRDHYAAMAQDRIDALKANVAAMELSPAKRKDMMNIIKQLETELASERVYFPFNRFGTFAVRGTTNYGQEYVAHYDSKVDAQRGLEAAQRKGFTDISITKIDSDQKTAEGAMTPEAYQMASRYAETMGGGAKAQEAIWRTFAHYSPHSAAMKKMLVRRNIAGMSEDMVRGLNQSINRDIRANELMKVKPQIDKIMGDVTKRIEEMRTIDHVDNTKQIEMMNEIKSRAEAKDTRAEWSKKVTKMNFAYYLGFNPASALINLTQNAIMGMPVLLGDHGFRVGPKMTMEFGHVMRNIADKGTMGYEGIELAAYKQLKAEQAIDVTNAHMMNDLNEGASTEANPFGIASKFVRASAWMFHNAEVANRVTMAMTAFKLEYERTGDYQSAVAYSKQKTFDAHLDFSEAGKSRYQQTDVGNVALALKSYPIGMAVSMVRSFNRSLFDSKATDQEKKQARYQLFGTFAATFVLGGAGALPLLGLLPEVFFALFGDDEEETPEHAFRMGVESIMGEDLADVFIDGLVGKATGLDLQSKVSLGLDMFARVQGGQSADDMKDAVVEGALGPVYAMVGNMTRGIDQMNEGKVFTGITTMLPTAIRNAIKSQDNLSRGTAQTSYETYVEDFDEKDAIWKFMGFNSSEYAEHYQEAQHERRLEQSVTKKKRYLLREYSLAFLQGDSDDRREARVKVREYNRGAAPENRISQSTIKRSITTYREKITGVK